MADSIFGNNEELTNNSDIFGTSKEENLQPVNSPEDNETETGETVYTTEELKNPANIHVSITDEKAPLVVLFGPPACGKTMTLVRLTRYLNKKGYTVQPDSGFRPTTDTNYSSICENFDTLISSDDAAASNNRINFMLIKVISKGRTVCQLLEAPGEYYYDKDNPTSNFPNFVNTVINSNNRKIWCIMVEPNWADGPDRKGYVNKIKRFKQRIKGTDRVAIVFNKIDKSSFVIEPGRIHTASAIESVNNLYPGIFEPFLNYHPITRFWRKYNCKFIPFQTGDYSNYEGTNKQAFSEGPEIYPRILWNHIMNMIHG